MNTMTDDEDCRMQEAIRIFKERPKRATFACACLGPAPGDPECRCRMASIVKVAGIFYQIFDSPAGVTARRHQKPIQQ